ncbi:hypothetical protein B0A52_01517 [Exophiala mesophila]|uniref:Isochorismatase-like domain-containing protein n=1 Tax=Exophiala mesophila TaxID=212818 RepID=A0A438NFB7_EXOME|nr:hypothetical protein B0A52_01517 [Exophiala mesophila]
MRSFALAEIKPGAIEKFRSAIWEYEKVISTTQKLVKAATILKMPIFVTTQNAGRLGPTVSEIESMLPKSGAGGAPAPRTVDKTLFSMMVPELVSQLPTTPATSPATPSRLSVILVGIETHICVTQTTLDLLRLGHKVYLVADGVSSCNELERPIALRRLAREGAVVTTSEGLLFELLGDAKSENFKAVSGLVKDTKDRTRDAVATLGKL